MATKVPLSTVKKIVKSKNFSPSKYGVLKNYIFQGKFTRALYKDYYNNVMMRNCSLDGMTPLEVLILVKAAFDRD